MLPFGLILLTMGISMILPGILKLRQSKIPFTFINSVRGPLGVDTGYSGNGTWKPIISGWGGLLIAIAFITFGFFFTYFSSVPSSSLPAILLFILMVGGIMLAYALVGINLRLNRFDYVIILLGIVTFIGLILIEVLVSILVPASFTPAASFTGISNFWLFAFYFSAGVAEEAMFSLFLLSLLVNMFKFKLGATFAIVLDSSFFMLYHSAVIGVIYTNTIYQSESYLIALFVGGIILRSMFYLTHHFAVPALGHGLLNLFVTAIAYGFVAIPAGYPLAFSPILVMPGLALTFHYKDKIKVWVNK